MIKKFFLFEIIVFFGIVTLSFAADEAETIKIENAELMPLSIIEGRLSLENYDGEELLILTTLEGKQYALKGELAEKELRTLEDLKNKKAILAGLSSNIHKKTVEIEQDYNLIEKPEARVIRGWEYTDFLVLYVEKVEETKEEILPSSKKEFAGPLLPLSETSVSLTIHRVRGEVISSYLKKPIPTIEVKDTAGKIQDKLILIVPKDTIVIKSLEGNIIHLMPTAIKRGDILDLWFETKGDENLARLITIIESR